MFDNCKKCNNGTWQAKDDFYISGMYCTECRQGWSGGDCLSECPVPAQISMLDFKGFAYSQQVMIFF